MCLAARVDVFTSPRQVPRKLRMDISPPTIDRRMQEAGLFGRVARHKRDYSPAELRQRLSFAQGYAGWSAEQWAQVLFSDEKCFFGKGFCGRVWVRREVGEALNPKYTIHKQAHPVKVNVWACFGAGGVGYMHIFNDNLNGKMYCKILRNNLGASADLVLPEGQQRFFLMDNAPTHKSQKAKEIIFNASCTALDFPPYSPDLSPIENLWSIMARRVEQRTSGPARRRRSCRTSSPTNGTRSSQKCYRTSPAACLHAASASLKPAVGTQSTRAIEIMRWEANFVYCCTLPRPRTHINL